MWYQRTILKEFCHEVNLFRISFAIIEGIGRSTGFRKVKVINLKIKDRWLMWMRTIWRTSR
jgi:hypothetical protein